jgi:hypothetical protein
VFLLLCDGAIAIGCNLSAQPYRGGDGPNEIRSFMPVAAASRSSVAILHKIMCVALLMMQANP